MSAYSLHLRLIFPGLLGPALLGAGLLFAALPGASGQSCPPVRDAAGNLVAPKDCAPSTPQAPAARRFPYPGETAPQSTPEAPPGNSPAQTPTAPQAPAGKRFPYPGETDSPAAPAAESPVNKTPLQDAGSSGDSSSNSSSSNSNTSSSSEGKPDANDPDANDPAAIPRRDRHRRPPGPRQTPTQRQVEDVQVAGFYFNDGNYKGSYDRAADAVSLDAEDAQAQLLLGNSARRLGKLDVAEKAFKSVLELDPVPKVRKAAEKALHEMTGQP